MDSVLRSGRAEDRSAASLVKSLMSSTAEGHTVGQ